MEWSERDKSQFKNTRIRLYTLYYETERKKWEKKKLEQVTGKEKGRFEVRWEDRT